MALYQVKLIKGVESLPPGSSVRVKSDEEYQPFTYEIQDAFKAEYGKYITMSDLRDNLEILRLF